MSDSCLRYMPLSHVITTFSCYYIRTISANIGYQNFLSPNYWYQHQPKKIPHQLGPTRGVSDVYFVITDVFFGDFQENCCWFILNNQYERQLLLSLKNLLTHITFFQTLSVFLNIIKQKKWNYTINRAPSTLPLLPKYINKEKHIKTWEKTKNKNKSSLWDLQKGGIVDILRKGVPNPCKFVRRTRKGQSHRP